MTVNELINELQHIADRGYGHYEVEAEDVGRVTSAAVMEFSLTAFNHVKIFTTGVKF